MSPETKFVTILREPIDNFESRFSAYEDMQGGSAGKKGMAG